MQAIGESIQIINGENSHRMLTIMQALYCGIPVKLNEMIYRLVQDKKEGVCPMMFMGEKQQNVIPAPDLSLKDLSIMVDQMPEHDFQALKFRLETTQRMTGIQGTNNSQVLKN